MTVDRAFKGMAIGYAVLVTGVAVATKIALRNDASGMSSIYLVLLTSPTTLIASPLHDAVEPPEGDQNLMLAMDVVAGYFQASLLWGVGHLISRRRAGHRRA
ncbi:SCO4225 family membrane protein [Spirillospora sp. CA-142024]|uniref:SCO4225 family membrane protein n=1 Tax=Spirillospora sp. CA-142024 TaxID=3240036 RepID=UPI003D94669E